MTQEADAHSNDPKPPPRRQTMVAKPSEASSPVADSPKLPSRKNAGSRSPSSDVVTKPTEKQVAAVAAQPVQLDPDARSHSGTDSAEASKPAALDHDFYSDTSDDDEEAPNDNNVHSGSDQLSAPQNLPAGPGADVRDRGGPPPVMARKPSVVGKPGATALKPKLKPKPKPKPSSQVNTQTAGAEVYLPS